MPGIIDEESNGNNAQWVCFCSSLTRKELLLPRVAFFKMKSFLVIKVIPTKRTPTTTSKNPVGSWRDGLLVKIAYYFCRTQGHFSASISGSFQLPITPASGNLKPCSGLCAHLHTHTHMIKIKESKLKPQPMVLLKRKQRTLHCKSVLFPSRDSLCLKSMGFRFPGWLVVFLHI